MRKIVIALVLLALAVPAFAVDPGDVVISQAYGGGGNSGALYNRDFVELFNRTNQPIDISNWTLQYGSATGILGGTSTSFQFTFAPGTTILPCNYYLVGMAFGSGTTLPALPTPDATGSFAMSGTGAKVALVADTTPLGASCTSANLIDIVAWATNATCAETAPAGATSNSTAVVRVIAGIGGYQDTNNNSVDFTVTAPSAHNSSSPNLVECSGDPVGTEGSTWGALKSTFR